MRGQLSAAILKARKALKNDPSVSRTELAKRVGLTRDALYKDPVCKGIIDQNKKERENAGAGL